MTDFTKQQSELYSELGQIIHDARKQAGLTQAELAIAVQLSRTSITNIESGRQKILLDTLYDIARALHVSVIDLLPETAFQGEDVETIVPSDLPEQDREWIRQAIAAATEEEN